MNFSQIESELERLLSEERLEVKFHVRYTKRKDFGGRSQFRPDYPEESIVVYIPKREEYTEGDLKRLMVTLAHEIGHIESGRNVKVLEPPYPVRGMSQELEADLRGYRLVRKWGITEEFLDNLVSKAQDLPKKIRSAVITDLMGFLSWKYPWKLE